MKLRKKILGLMMIVMALTFSVNVQAQAKQKVRLKVNALYENYSKKIKGTSKVKNYKLLITENGTVIHNKNHKKKKFSVTVGKQQRNTTFKIKVVRNGAKYKSVTRKVRAKWWENSRYSNKKGVVKSYKKNASKIELFCKSAYYMNVKIIGTNGNTQKKNNIKKVKILKVEPKIGSIKQINLAIYKKSDKTKVATESVKTTSKSNDKGNSKTNTKKDNDSTDINWGEDNIDKLLAQVSKSPKYNKMLYKKNEYTIVNESDERAYGIIINPYYSQVQWYTKSDYNRIINEIKKYVSESHITNEMSDQEKAYRAARYMINHIDYDIKVEGQTIEQALFEHKTVCAGFSKTYALICRFMGIDCDYVYSPSHAWNYVKMREYYYVTDLTRAYFEVKNGNNSGTFDMFCRYEYISNNNRNNMKDIFKNSEYKKGHPVDTIDYFDRCEKEGKDYLTRLELSKLPE